MKLRLRSIWKWIHA